MPESIVIAAARRTPIGGFQGIFSPVSATQLGSVAAAAALADSGLSPDAIDEVIFGCVLPAGLGQAPARQAAVGAGIAMSVPATTVNKMCGSGMKAVMLAADQIRAGSARAILAGGLESMTNAPYLMLKARAGYRMGHAEIYDHMFYDGLQSPWDGKAMGCFADVTAAKYGFSRADQDAFAAESVRRAQRASKEGDFVAEIAPVTIKTRKGEQVVAIDETPFQLDIDKIPTLKPAFGKDGTVTAASSSSISDGAAAIVIASESAAQGGRPQAARAARLLREPRAGPRVVHDGARPFDAEGDRPRGLEGRRRRPVRNQRSVRLRGDGRDEGPRPAARPGQRERRRVRDGPPRRRHGRPHHHHAALRAAQARPAPRRRLAVHRRR